MVGLSEKAKGKQRAIEPEAEDDLPIFSQVVIRFTEGVEDLHLTLSPTDSVRVLKEKVWGTSKLEITVVLMASCFVKDQGSQATYTAEEIKAHPCRPYTRRQPGSQ